jgi:hypothetical protein
MHSRPHLSQLAASLVRLFLAGGSPVLVSGSGLMTGKEGRSRLYSDPPSRLLREGVLDSFLQVTESAWSF